MLNSDDDEFNAFRLMAKAEVAQVRTEELGRVVGYDHKTQTVTVQPIMQTIDNRNETKPAASAKGIPVRFPDFGGWVLVSDIEEGTTGTIHYIERGLEAWAESGSDDIKPTSTERWQVGDAYFVPGLRPNGVKLPEAVARAGEMVLSKSDGTVQIRLKDGEIIIEGASIKLGANATKLLALADKIDKFIALVDSILSAWVIVPGDGGLALQAAYKAARISAFGPLAAPIGSVAATKVKGE